MYAKAKIAIIVFDVLLFLLLIRFLPYGEHAARGLALLVFVGILWLTEAIHITVTALLIPVLASIMGLLPTATALASFANSTIFLYFGGFALAAALHLQQLDKLFALKIIRLARGNFILSVIYLFLVTAFLSMWVNNASTAAMMMPLTLGLLADLDAKANHRTFVFVLLGVAYSCSIGGMGTAVGSIPNAIVVSQLNITFADMFIYAFPVMLVMMAVMIVCLYAVIRPDLSVKLHGLGDEKIPMTRERITALCIFAGVALMWVFSGQINPVLSSAMGMDGLIENLDSIVAVVGAILIVLLKVVSWDDLEDNINLGVLYLFGGGITLSIVLSNTGASRILADLVVSMIEDSHYYVIGVAVALFVIFMTEVVSNAATATLLVPIFITIAETIGAPPLGIALIIAIGASCAFMLPVATPPNTFVYSTGHIRLSEMVRLGILLNIISALAIGTYGYLFWL